MPYTVLRDGSRIAVPLWALKVDDLILAVDDRFYSVAAFPELRQHFPQLPSPVLSPPSLPDFLRDLGTVLFIGAGICFAAEVIASLFAPQRNDLPLTRSMRNYIRERDGEICLYCEVSAPDGHVDHRVSRSNGGSNDFDNLAWACAPCNWSKGAMNDGDFISLFN